MLQQRCPSTFFMPSEWTLHSSCWLAWPSDELLWKENLKEVQSEVEGLCRQIIDQDPDSGCPRGESLDILVSHAIYLQQAQSVFKDLPVRFHVVPFGDIWLRDTGPIVLMNAKGAGSVARFQFNGWGNKYILPHDDQVSVQISHCMGFQCNEIPLVLEGGAIEVDGEGTCLTTRQCLLNVNRNPQKSENEIEALLRKVLGVEKILWLDRGLLHDHTDGHIDNIARFVAPGVVLCMESQDEDDPQSIVLQEVIQSLEKYSDAQGRDLNVIRIPSPGLVRSQEGQILPASYLNFYIGNSTVVVPTFQKPMDTKAVQRIAQFFPSKRVVGMPARALLHGGGTFHCITQQQPKTLRQGGE